MNLVVPKNPARFIPVAAMLCLCLAARPFSVAAQDYYQREISYPAGAYSETPSSGDTLSLTNRFYIGAGGAYNLRGGDGDEIDLSAVDYWEYWGYSCPISPSFDNGWGWNIKVGYFFSEYLALEARFHQHLKYKLKGDCSFTEDFIDAVDVVEARVEGEVKGYDLSINGKIFIPASDFRPYGILGLGYLSLRKEWDGWASVTTYDDLGNWWLRVLPYTKSESVSGILFRIGAGADYFITEDLGLEAELSYNKGFGDVDEVAFFAINLGVLVAF